ncbi:unnamed protein product [Rotaria sordida]|uniref:Uncharacterized protein n=1 Tax=Rotaria sordida TaxID=392033 RepID=A0A819STH9_9BILA|nr:unnamed protein product [Rotaria sordida]
MTSDTSRTIFLAGCGGGYDIFGDNVYFPEQRLANELHVPVYAILCDYVETHIELIVEAYRYLMQGCIIDDLVLIDGGSDVLLTGNELQLGEYVNLI